MVKCATALRRGTAAAADILCRFTRESAAQPTCMVSSNSAGAAHHHTIDAVLGEVAERLMVR
jgi:hypothetical protein